MLTRDAARAVELQARLQGTLQVHARVLLMRHSTRKPRAKRWCVGEAELQIAKAAGWNSQVDPSPSSNPNPNPSPSPSPDPNPRREARPSPRTRSARAATPARPSTSSVARHSRTR